MIGGKREKTVKKEQFVIFVKVLFALAITYQISNEWNNNLTSFQLYTYMQQKGSILT